VWRARPSTVNSFDRNLTIFHLPFSRPTHRRDLRSVKSLDICKSFPFWDFFTSSRYDHGGFSYASTSSLSVSISGLLVTLYHPAYVAGRSVSSRLHLDVPLAVSSSSLLHDDYNDRFLLCPELEIARRSRDSQRFHV
jgi:hypothetical protein